VRLSLFWQMLIGFGVVVVAIILLHNIIFADLDDVFEAVSQITASEVRAIDAARKIPPLLDEEERAARAFLVLNSPAAARLRLETHDRVAARIDSLEQFLNTPEERSLLSAVRRTHQTLFASAADQRTAPASASIRIADSMSVLRARLEQLVHTNQHVITTTVGSVGAESAHNADMSLWITCAALLATLGVALLIARTTHATHKPMHRHMEPPRHTPPPLRSPISDFKQLDRYKSEMMEQISQELRIPLQTMHAAYYVLAEQIAGPLNDRQKQLVNTIRDNVEALSSFSSQFLDLARIEAGMMEYERQQVDLISLVTPVINAARPGAAAKEITIGLAAQYVPPVSVDPSRFATVVSNLLSNAIKFTPYGGNITVNISPSGTGARIAVKDSGIGIDADDLPKLFTKFFQARSATTIDAKGTGMGLALVKAIVDGHGGRVYATSKIGVGSTFTVELPRASAGPLPHPPDVN
jgi:signal transduction histidine kinase